MNRALFPHVRTLEEFERIRHDDERFRPGARVICETLGLPAAPLARFPSGSLPVYAVGDSLVLKLYPPFDHQERDHERTVLRAVEGRLPIPTPGVRADGAFEEWGYLLMDRLRGQNLEDTWPTLSSDDGLQLAEQLGSALAALHAVRDPQLDHLRVDWPAFIQEQQRTAVERQRARGLEERWCEQIPRFLDRVFLDRAKPDSLLHTEIMREHLLVESGPRGWYLSGLFDFEPAMIGGPEYEFVAVGLFFSCGEAAILRRVLLAYGYEEARLDHALAERLLGYGLLHRYSNLPWFLRRVPPGGDADTLEALADRWWGMN